jgi:paraquat-inducible protein B
MVLDHPPLTPVGTPGVSVILTSDDGATLGPGDPVIYQGQSVGRVETAKFSVAKNRMRYTLFIRAPFDTQVLRGTQFWLRSGFQFHFGAEGIDVETGSLQAILSGGVTFGLLQGVNAGSKVNNGATFKLYATRRAAEQDRFNEKIRYILLASKSVRGLYAGAPVEYRGVRIGTVLQVPFFPKGVTFHEFGDSRMPLLIAIEPQRISSHWINWTRPEWRQHIRGFEKKGLRATITAANLLTGAKFIELQYYPDAPAHTEEMIGDYPVFPIRPNSLANIPQQVSSLLKKINGLKLSQLVAGMQTTLSTSNATLGEIRTAVNNLNKVLATHAARELPDELQSSLRELRRTLSAYQRGAPVYRNLNRSLERLNRVLGNLAPAAQTLRDKPNALIFGSSEGPDPIPRAAR